GEIKCTVCHIPDLQVNFDRRVADAETVFDPTKGGLNGLFATATPLHSTADDDSGFPPLKRPLLGTFLVKNIFTDFKRHDLGPDFHERNYDGTLQKEFLTAPLWGVGSTSPYGHDGRSINLKEVILRHGGEALASAQAFASLSEQNQEKVIAFLNSLVLFPPDDTASNLSPANSNTPGFPQFGHGSIKLSVLFNDPNDLE
ncbi:MAG TPA: di-heme oxidoredictase family protein, partial [Candidatus Saccharimonadales bacterium]|nr:di-heme oxidoredictase family protein [Candidatus Saccharimonadales bacterium]